MRRGGWGRSKVGRSENRNKDSIYIWDDKEGIIVWENMGSLEEENDRSIIVLCIIVYSDFEFIICLLFLMGYV